LGLRGKKWLGGWRRLHDDKLLTLYASPNIIGVIISRRMGWAGHIARVEEMRNAFKIFVIKLEGKRPLRKPRRRWDDNIRMNLREICGYVLMLWWLIEQGMRLPVMVLIKLSAETTFMNNL
jgi:hypothetical protein